MLLCQVFFPLCISLPLFSFCSFLWQNSEAFIFFFSDFYNLPRWLMETSLLFFRKWCYSSSLWFLPGPDSMTYFSSACPVSWSFLTPHVETHTWRQSEGKCSFSISGVGKCSRKWKEDPQLWMDFLLSKVGRNCVPCLLTSQSPSDPPLPLCRSHGDTSSVLRREKDFLQPHSTQLIQPEH